MAETAERPACFYRPRRVRDSPLYRLAEEHFETFKQVYDDRFASRYGFWRAEVERTLLAFLDCGLPEGGFARVRCSSCRHEFLLAFSCGMRGFCMSCHSKRAALWAEHLAEHLLLSVPHDQWVFTVPKRLRLFFLYDRTLLGDLARCAWDTVRDLYLAAFPDSSARPGMVVAIQTYGDQAANWQPHIHALVTSGLIDPDGEFTPLDRPPSAVAEELFRRHVLKMLVDLGKLDEDTAAGILGWQHTGFSVHNAIRVEAEDAEGIDKLCRYLVHPPIALDRLEVLGASRPCTYRGRRPHPVTGEQTVTLDPLEMLARLCQHIPTPRLHLTRQYGAYASRTRASRARRCTRTMGAFDTTAAGTLEPEPLTAFQRERRKAWARLIKKVFECDPLRCPNCSSEMKVIAFILDPPVIRKILEHLRSLPHGPPHPSAAQAAS